jgi:hypothetical protein
MIQHQKPVFFSLLVAMLLRGWCTQKKKCADFVESGHRISVEIGGCGGNSAFMISHDFC